MELVEKLDDVLIRRWSLSISKDLDVLAEVLALFKTALADARNAALEETAKAADEAFDTARTNGWSFRAVEALSLAEKIRALKEPKP